MPGITANVAWAGTLDPRSVQVTQLEPGDLSLDRSTSKIGSARVVSCTGIVGYRGHSELLPGRTIVGVTADPSTDVRWFGQPVGEADILHTNTSMDFTAYGRSDAYYVAIDTDKLESNDGRHVFRSARNAKRLRDYLATAIALSNRGENDYVRQIEGTLIPFLSLCLSDEDASSAPVVLSRRVAAVRACETYVRENLEEYPTLLQLCKVSGLRVRSLINAFQAVIGMSPMTYLRAHRLNEARKEFLASDSPGTRVIDVATKWGFWHMGHFAARYRELFGELPTETLNRRS